MGSTTFITSAAVSRSIVSLTCCRTIQICGSKISSRFSRASGVSVCAFGMRRQRLISFRHYAIPSATVGNPQTATQLCERLVSVPVQSKPSRPTEIGYAIGFVVRQNVVELAPAGIDHHGAGRKRQRKRDDRRRHRRNIGRPLRGGCLRPFGRLYVRKSAWSSEECLEVVTRGGGFRSSQHHPKRSSDHAAPWRVGRCREP